MTLSTMTIFLHTDTPKLGEPTLNHFSKQPIKELRAIIRNYGNMRKVSGSVHILPTREWEAGYDPDEVSFLKACC